MTQDFSVAISCKSLSRDGCQVLRGRAELPCEVTVLPRVHGAKERFAMNTVIHTHRAVESGTYNRTRARLSRRSAAISAAAKRLREDPLFEIGSSSREYPGARTNTVPGPD